MISIAGGIVLGFIVLGVLCIVVNVLHEMHGE